MARGAGVDPSSVREFVPGTTWAADEVWDGSAEWVDPAWAANEMWGEWGWGCDSWDWSGLGGEWSEPKKRTSRMDRSPKTQGSDENASPNVMQILLTDFEDAKQPPSLPLEG